MWKIYPTGHIQRSEVALFAKASSVLVRASLGYTLHVTLLPAETHTFH